MIKIGIMGLAGSGKSTFASMLAVRLRSTHSCSRYSFASKVRDVAAALLGIPVGVVFSSMFKASLLEELYPGYKGTPLGAYTGRKLLQEIGTEAMRGWMSNIWVTLLEVELKKARTDIVIVDDVRFLNEAAIFDHMIEIKRPGVVATSHASEALSANADFERSIVINDRDEESLSTVANEIASEILETIYE